MDSSLTITCPSCSRQLKLPMTAMGKNVKCPGCNAIFQHNAEDFRASPPAEVPGTVVNGPTRSPGVKEDDEPPRRRYEEEDKRSSREDPRDDNQRRRLYDYRDDDDWSSDRRRSRYDDDDDDDDDRAYRRWRRRMDD